MKGDVLCWLKWMHYNHMLLYWFSFTKALVLRSNPSGYPNHQTRLFKLNQKGSIFYYLTKFKNLGNQVARLPQKVILIVLVPI